MTNTRLDTLRHRLTAPLPGDGEGQRIDGLLVSNDQNRRYVSGFTGSSGYLLVTAEQALLLTDFRYIEQATAQAPDFSVVKIEARPAPAIAEQVKALGLRCFGFESEDVTIAAHQRLLEALHETAPDAQAVPATGMVEALREVKDGRERDLLRRAVEVGDRAFEHVAARLKPGMTERQVAWQLETHMREHGAERVSFDIIVAAGPHGAMPHHRPTDRPIQSGEPIVIDMGCRLNGYCSDLTRTITLGEADAKFWEIYWIVLRAQQTCEDGLRAGMLGKDADALARGVIEAAGHGEQFGHGTGHGVGLEVHEGPLVSKTRGEAPLPEGSVVTVEPGIYLPGWGGVRIEDMVVVGQARCQVLTTAHKNPVVNVGGSP